MPETTPPRSSIGSLIASKRRRRDGSDPSRVRREDESLRTRLERTGETVLEGHVVDPADPERRFVVELLLNDRPAGIARADLFDAGLGEEKLGDGCYGFRFHLDPAALPSLRTAALRIANLGEPLHRLPLDGNTFASSKAPFGRAEWQGGLVLSGWIRHEAQETPPLIEARIDGAVVARARADTWRSVAGGGTETAERGFEIALPRRFADGRAKQVEVACEGRALPGSPVWLIAFPDGLEAFLDGRAEVDAEKLRGRLFDDRFPDTVPFEAFCAFDARFPAPAEARSGKAPVAIAVIGEAGAEASLSGPALDADDDWVGGILPAPAGRFEPDDLVRFLEDEAKDCAFVLLVPAGVRLRPGLIDRLAAALEAEPGADIGYGDALVVQEDCGLHPLALPAFDYERTLEQGTGSACFAMRRAAALEAARRGIADLARLFLAPLDTIGPRRSAHLHVPGFGFEMPLPAVRPASEALAAATRAHLAERGIAAEITVRAPASLPGLRVRRSAPERSLTLIVDAGGDAGTVEACLDALEATRARTRLSLVVAAPPDEALRQRLRLAAIAFCEAPAGGSAARRIGAAMEMAEGELVCLLDARLRPTTPDWLDELVSRIAEPDVGAVGPLLSWPSGVVAEAGWVLRATGEPVAAFTDRRTDDPGYGDALLVARQVAAVGRACLLTRRADFRALGGFDPLLFPSHYGAVDYCLKLQALGRRVVVTPDAHLVFAAAMADEAPDAAREREERLLRARWPEVCAGDPFYSPLLGRGARPYAGLAWPPGDLSPRRPGIAPARNVPPGW